MILKFCFLFLNFNYCEKKFLAIFIQPPSCLTLGDGSSVKFDNVIMFVGNKNGLETRL